MTNEKYKDLFERQVEHVKHIGGTVGLHPAMYNAATAAIVTALPAKEENELATNNSMARYQACHFIMRADSQRYGRLQDLIQNETIF